eukprot:CAMPEP_0177655882 /NCGR_PEP_ID=MMETSP0447-20121125/15232_1 /TAXON_ID=0 /ORGANISM="Stygamoeba regulata, Strain BSH-02190019" /LENGTH=284 /DNA_ID=CAMNT_0019159887 /DNA_START=98 /DNA_END=952 /DNA_ORIENTATION=+
MASLRALMRLSLSLGRVSQTTTPRLATQVCARPFTDGGDMQKYEFLPRNRNFLLRSLRSGRTLADLHAEVGTEIKTPEEAALALELGNARFVAGKTRRDDSQFLERRVHYLAQEPFAAILGCSDSRVPVEMVFDQSFGKLFVVRVAGNIATPFTMASLEYAILVLGVRVVLVLGHEACGAVGAALQTDEQVKKFPDNIQKLLGFISPHVQSEWIHNLHDERSRGREAAFRNVTGQVNTLMSNTLLRDRVDAGSLKIMGGFYEISSGMVDFVEFQKRQEEDEGKK